VIDIIADGARLADGHVTVTHDRDFAKGVDGVDLGGMRHDRHEGIGYTFLGAGDARDPYVIALRSADNLKLWHGVAPRQKDWLRVDRSTSRVAVHNETTRGASKIDSAVDFFGNDRV